MKKKVQITIDDCAVNVDEGLNLIAAAKLINKKIPHYCYHAGLSPDGNCRMCLVELDGSPKPVIACKTGAAQGMVVITNSANVKKMRESVMEFLLINHPLDCPTCDQAGECKLQDYYMDYDVKPSRYQEEKVHKDKMVGLGAGVMLDEERCIVCTRCVRFCQEIAKNEELYVQARGHHSMVSIFPGKKMTSPYAGNTVDICPVGALTSINFRFKKRVWFLQETPSVCPGCARGCNISVHHAEGKVYRLKPRLNPQVNSYWMCDFGRNDYKFINENRCLKPGVWENGRFAETSYAVAAARLAELVQKYKPYEIAFVASARECNEEIDAFVAVAKVHYQQDFVYYSFNDPKDPYADDILIVADKNANKSHVEKLGLRPLKEVNKDVRALIVQRELNPTDRQIVHSKNLSVLALYATNNISLKERALTTFPIPTFAEQEGSFTNVDGMVQKFLPAFPPRGEAMPMRSYQHGLVKMARNWLKAG